MIFFSKNLAYLRRKMKLKQKDFGDLVGLKPNTISNYENGESSPDFLILEKFVKILKVDTHTLLFNDIEEQETETLNMLREPQTNYGKQNTVKQNNPSAPSNSNGVDPFIFMQFVMQSLTRMQEDINELKKNNKTK